MEQSVGSRFVAIDFHVHTPGSSDFKDRDAQAADIISAALGKGLDAIVITDHNTTAWIDILRSASKDSGLIIFPGFEVNAQGGHILGIFDPNVDIGQIETALIEAGISKVHFGIEKEIGKDIPSVLDAIAKNGGIGIGAHIDGPKGFLTTINQGAANEKYFKDPNLSAVEIVDQSLKDDFVAGKRYDRVMACIQGSDAHSLLGIGTKFTYIKTQHLNLDGLRLVFSEPKLRIKLRHEYFPKNIPFIKSLTVSQGFLSGHKFEFNPGLNCLVGGAGSGKSSILEFIRFSLDQVSKVDQVVEDVEGKLSDLAGVGCDICLELVLDTGETVVVKRHFDGHENRIYVHKASNGDLMDVNISDTFPIHAYSQGEAINIARNPLAQLELIDKHLDISIYQDEIANAYSELEGQVDGLLRLDARTKDKQIVEKDLNTTSERINSLTVELTQLEAAQKSQASISHSLWLAEKNYLVDLVNSFSETKKEIEVGLKAMTLSTTQIPTPLEVTPNKDMLQECNKLALQLEAIQNEAKKLMLSKLDEIEKQIRDKASDWKKKYQVHEDEYKTLKVDQTTTRIFEINGALEDLRKKQQNYRANLEAIKRAGETLERMLGRRKELLETIKDQKNRIRVLRERKIKEFIKQIGDTIFLKLIPEGNRKEYEKLIVEIFKGTYASRTIAEKIYTAIEPQELYGLITKDAMKDVVDKSGIEERWAKNLIQQVNANPAYLYRLQSVRLEDLLEIGLKIGHGKYKPLEKLSTGQKATVIVLLTMVEGKYPIIFDQPEDALYTPFIYTEVVKILREGKDQRQFILATHNSNIAVAGDTDFSIVIDGSSTNTSIEATGGLEDENTKMLMLLHLEGGRDALVSRFQKFGIRTQ